MKYLWYFQESLYSKEECEELIEISNQYTDPPSYLRDNPANGKNLNVNVLERKFFGNKLDKFYESCDEINTHIFGFDVSIPRGLNINRYTSGNEYKFHRDSLPEGFAADTKFTALLNLSTKPYTGGDFYIFDSEPRLIREINTLGSILLFPSFLYHKVAPVTSGERVTLSVWFNGPNWK
jgi:hypothetical protein